LIYATMLASLLFGSHVSALTLKETKIVKDWNEAMDKANAGVKTACNKDIKAMMDQKTWLKDIPKYMAESQSMTHSCEGTMEAIATLCADADAKAAITKKISAVKCYGGAKDKELKFEMKGTTVEVTVGSWGFYDSKAKEWLENNL